MKTFFQALMALVVVACLSFLLNGLGLVRLSFWGPKFEEANRQVVQQSIRRQEGVSEGIGALCLNMRTATDPASKRAYAHLIVQQGTANNTILDNEALQCLAEANRELSL